MNKILKLAVIGGIGGVALMFVLKIVMLFNGNPAYILLFNFDYIPVLNQLKPVWLFGYFFHFLTCMISVIALYFILGKYHNRIMGYVLVFTIGGGALFFLTALSHQPPASSDIMAWVFWTFGHAVFGYVVGILTVKWV